MKIRGLIIFIIVTISFTSLRLILDIEGSRYKEIGVSIDGYDVMTYSDRYYKSDKYEDSYTKCSVGDIYVYTIGDLDYYYESDLCSTYSGSLVHLYYVDYYTSSFVGIDVPYSLSRYLVEGYENEVTHELLMEMDFIKTKESKYVSIGKSIMPDMVSYDIKSYSDSYYNDNSYCMEEYEIILYEDDVYEYVYNYESCYSSMTEHVVFSGVGRYGVNYTNIDTFINRNIDFITWCDIEATGIGVKQLKDTTYNIPVSRNCGY